MSYYLIQEDSVKVVSDNTMTIDKKLPCATYTILENPNTGELSLKMGAELAVPSILYGDTVTKATRIYETFKRRDSSTGALLSGLKGTGKTLLAKYLSVLGRADDIPTILINRPYRDMEGFMKFIQSIEEPCVVIFDEFEKVFDHRGQDGILTLLDGVMSSKNLYIFTCNNKYGITNHMYNRPSRVYFSIDYPSLDSEFIKEYCDNELEHKDKLPTLLSVFNLFDEINFDMVQTLVNEVNHTNQPAFELVDDLNITPICSGESEYTVVSIEGGEPVAVEEEDDDNTFAGLVSKSTSSKDTWYGNLFEEEIKIYHNDQRMFWKISDLVKRDANNKIWVFKNAEGQTVTLQEPSVSSKWAHHAM